VKRIWEIITFFIIVSLVLPVGVFAAPITGPSRASAPVAVTPQIVKVVAAIPRQTVLPQSSAVSACSSAASVSEGLVQNFGAVNLNQPASCFKLVPASKFAALPALAVVSMRQAAVVVLQNQNRISKSPLLAPEPQTRDMALPVLVFAASALVVFEEKKSVQKAAVRLSEYFIQSLTLHQLGILRC
jgi:hypothetical protein